MKLSKRSREPVQYKTQNLQANCEVITMNSFKNINTFARLSTIVCTVFVLSLPSVFAQTQGNPPCYVCGYANATLTNPTFTIDASPYSPGIGNVTCSQISDAGLAGVINSTNCDLIQAQTAIQQACGCTPPPGYVVTTAPAAATPVTSAPVPVPVAVTTGTPTTLPVAVPAVPTAPVANPPCYVCGNDPAATVANPDLVLDLTPLNVSGVTEASCSLIVQAGINGLLTPLQCTQVTTDPRAIEAFAIPCGCSAIATTVPVTTSAPTPVAVPAPAPVAVPTPTVTTQSPIATDGPYPACFICQGDATATINYPNVTVDVSYLGLGGITKADCQQIYDAGIAGFLSPDICTLAQANTTTLEICGCSNIIPNVTTPTYAPTTSTLPPISADDTLASIIEKKQNLSTLNQALTAANLTAALADTSYKLTVFGPTNKAFEDSNQSAYLTTLVTNPSYIIHLQNLLLFHAVNELLPSSNITVNNVNPTTMLNNENITISRTAEVGGTITLTYPYNANASAEVAQTTVNVITPDITASNGILDTLDGVMLPFFVSQTLNALLSTSTEGFTIFPELFVLAFPNGLPPAEYTVLAPVDAAFEKLGSSLLDTLKLPENKDALTQILLYHVIEDIYPSVLLVNGQVLTSLGGSSITVSITTDPLTGTDTITFDDGKTLIPNILANNGIVYALDTVLIPTPSFAPSAGTPSGAPAISDFPSSSPLIQSDIPSEEPTRLQPTRSPSARLPPNSSVRVPPAYSVRRPSRNDSNGNGVNDNIENRKDRRRYYRQYRLHPAPASSNSDNNNKNKSDDNKNDNDKNDNNNNNNKSKNDDTKSNNSDNNKNDNEDNNKSDDNKNDNKDNNKSDNNYGNGQRRRRRNGNGN